MKTVFISAAIIIAFLLGCLVSWQVIQNVPLAQELEPTAFEPFTFKPFEFDPRGGDAWLDPFDEFDRLSKYMDRLNSRLPFSDCSLDSLKRRQTEKQLTFELDTCDMTLSNVDVNVTERSMQLSADAELNNGNSSYSTHIRQSFTLPTEVVPGSMTIQNDKGRLVITLDKVTPPHG